MKTLTFSIARVIVCILLVQGIVNEKLNAQSLGFFNVHHLEHDKVDNNISVAALSYQHGIGDDFHLAETLLKTEHIVLFILAVVYICIIYFGHSKRLKSGNNYFSLLLLLCLFI